MTPRPPRYRLLSRFTVQLVALSIATLIGTTSCSTMIAFPVSPITGAIGGIEHNDCAGWDAIWGYPLGFIAGFVWGPIMALSIGISADVGFVSNGAYGEDGYPTFFDALDPYGYALTRPEAPSAPANR